MDKKIRLGIIGLGNMGSGHARSIMEGKCPDFDLVAVADINPARVEWGKANLAGNIRYFDAALAMLTAAASTPAWSAYPITIIRATPWPACSGAST